MVPSFIKLVAALLVAGLLPILGLPSPVEKRDGAQFLDMVEFFREYKLQMEEYCIALYPFFRYEDACRLATDNSSWAAITYSHHGISPAEYVWAPDDATTANCLINLHHKQETECISLRGSECEIEAGASKILNSRLYRDDDRLTLEDTVALQAASEALIGAKVNSIAPNPNKKISSGVCLAHIDRAEVDEYNQVEMLGALRIFFGGADPC